MVAQQQFDFEGKTSRLDFTSRHSPPVPDV